MQKLTNKTKKRNIVEAVIYSRLERHFLAYKYACVCVTVHPNINILTMYEFIPGGINYLNYILKRKDDEIWSVFDVVANLQLLSIVSKTSKVVMIV